jgi:hypothetical protein
VAFPFGRRWKFNESGTAFVSRRAGAEGLATPLIRGVRRANADSKRVRIQIVMTLQAPFVLATLFMAAWAASASERLNALDVHALIKKLGASEALQQLFGDVKSEKGLADCIATGRPDWLDIAAELRPVSDGAASEVLCISMQGALPRNPVGVLNLVREGIFGIKEACGGYGVGQIEDQRPTELILGLVDLRLRIIDSVTEPSLKQQKTLCLRELKLLRTRLEVTLENR